MSNFYQDFMRELLQRLKLTNEEGKVDEGQVEAMGEQLEKRLGLQILKALPQDQMDPYLKLIDQNANPQEIQDFLTQHIPNFGQQRERWLVDFAKEFMDRTNQIRSSLQPKA